MALRKLGSLVGITCLLALGFMVSAGTPASACSCVGPLSHGDYSELADAAFIGDVVAARLADSSSIQGEVRLDSPEMIYEVEVRDVYKGSVRRRVEVSSSLDGASCGAGLAPNQRLMVYARATESSSPAPLTTSLCDGTHKVSGGPILEPPLVSRPASPPPPPPHGPTNLLAVGGVAVLSAAIGGALIGIAGRT